MSDASEPTVLQMISPPVYECKGCGGCCQGVQVEMTSAEERLRIDAFAKALGVEDVFDGSVLRSVGGRCVLLEEDTRCALHRVFGEAAKPSVCRQFPFILLRSEGGLRAGIDPSAASGLEQEHSEPMPLPSEALFDVVEFGDAQAKLERELLEKMSGSGVGVLDVLVLFCGKAAVHEDDLSPAFAARLVLCLRHSFLERVLKAADAGPFQKRYLLPMIQLACALDPMNTPPFKPMLSSKEERFVLSSLRQMLFLRRADPLLMVQGAGLLCLVGVVLAKWAHDDERSFGRAVASWFRLLRAEPFWHALVGPGLKRLRWLAVGGDFPER